MMAEWNPFIDARRNEVATKEEIKYLSNAELKSEEGFQFTSFANAHQKVECLASCVDP